MRELFKIDNKIYQKLHQFINSLEIEIQIFSF